MSDLDVPHIQHQTYSNQVFWHFVFCDMAYCSLCRNTGMTLLIHRAGPILLRILDRFVSLDIRPIGRKLLQPCHRISAKPSAPLSECVVQYAIMSSALFTERCMQNDVK